MKTLVFIPAFAIAAVGAGLAIRDSHTAWAIAFLALWFVLIAAAKTVQDAHYTGRPG